MVDKSEITVEQAFELMDEWRHLPAYQLERRADIFFALFLPEVLGKHFEIPMNPILVPEFPIKNPENNQSSKIDYLALQQSRDRKPKRAFLVELKTDMSSRREEQDRVLGYAVHRQMKKLVLDVIEICRATSERSKYVHLLMLLSKVELICEPIEYKDVHSFTGREFSNFLDKIKATVEAKEHWPTLRAIYIQPTQPEPADIIDFNEFAERVEKRGKIGDLFAKRLRNWARIKAGSLDPKDFPL